MTTRRALAALAVLGITLTACAPEPLVARPGLTPSPAVTPRDGGTPTAASMEASPTPTVAACVTRAGELSLEQQVGQLFMVGVSTSGLDETTRSAVSMGRVGSAVLLGNSTATADDIDTLTTELSMLGSADLPFMVAVDQEGGTVQRLKGEGFDAMPPAREQGAMPAGELKAAAERWGGELAAAGVAYNLAPVGDIVPEDKQSTNPPIGALKRDFGSDPKQVSRSVVEFIDGMRAAGIVTSVKHFPGLGQVETNTDFGAARDDVTTANGPSIEPFRAAIAADVDSVMVSSAVFTRIDKDNEGVFSSKVITDLLRGDLGYDGVVIADDLGAAKAVRDVAPADRAVRFIQAGGDIVINADPSIMGDMIEATTRKASEDAGFADQVAASAARVLTLKESAGLLECGA